MLRFLSVRSGSWKAIFRLSCLLILANVSTGSCRADDKLVATIERIEASVVGIGSFKVLRAPQAQLFGTGFVIDGGWVVTNAHVTDRVNKDEGEGVVVFSGRGEKTRVLKASVIGRDATNDLALLEISPAGSLGLKGLKLSGSTLYKPGTSIAFTGYPIGAVLGFYPVTHVGIISSVTPIVIPAQRAGQLSAKALRRLKNPFYVYQLDATAYPGNSGSPVFLQETGEVIGVINKVFIKETKESVLEKPSGITYAIPVSALHALVDRVKR